MARTSMASHDDATLLARMRFSEGFMKAIDNRHTAGTVNSSLLIADGAFGHVGAGGSLGFADPDCRMSFGYAMNRMGTGLLLNERATVAGRCGLWRARLSLQEQRRLVSIDRQVARRWIWW